MKIIFRKIFTALAGIILFSLSATSAHTQPANDNFANAMTIAGWNAQVNGSNVGATIESGETNTTDNLWYPGEFGGHSVWWMWTSPSNGVVSVDTQGSSFETELMIYSGTSLSTVQLVSYDNDSGSNYTSALKFNAVAGTVYQIWVDGWNGATGSIVLHLNYPIITSQSVSQTNAISDTPTLYVSVAGTNLTYQWYSGNSGNQANPITGATNSTYTTPPLSTSTNFWVSTGNALAMANSKTMALTVLPRVATPAINPSGGQLTSPAFVMLTCTTTSANIYYTLDGSLPTTNSILYSGAFNVTNPATLQTAAFQSGYIGSFAASAVFWSPSIVAWGNDDEGECNIPSGLGTLTAISAGAEHCLAIKNDGTIVAWGENLFGQATVPAGLLNVTAIAAGGAHSLALSGGIVTGWGTNLDGQVTIPASPTGVKAIAAGGAFSMALNNDGKVLAWGNNVWGQTNVPPGLGNIKAIAAGQYHCLALLSNSTVVAWGLDYTGQTNVPPGLTNVIAIAAGGDHNLALKANGTVVAWGDNSYGQTNVPVGLTNVVAISGGASHSAALKADGTLVLWGDNSFVQSTLPAGLNGGTTVATGYYHDLAIVFPTNLPPGITTQPQSITIFSNQTTTLSIGASGSGLAYQWYIGSSGNTASLVSSATNSSYSTPPLTNTTAYWVSVTNSTGGTNSVTATVTVILPTPPTIAGQPQSVTNAYGTATTLSVVASGLQLSYQWYSGNSGNTANLIGGAILPGYSTPTLTTTTSYWVRVSNPAGATNSATAVVTITPPALPVITSQPQSVTNTYNSATTLSVTATGQALNYQWYSGNSGDTSAPIGGATATSYNTPSLTATTSYWVLISNPGGTTNSATATVTTLPLSTNNLVWKGGNNGNVWDADITTNWLNGSISSVFINGNAVAFDDTGNNSTPAILTGMLQPASVTVNNTAKNYIWGGPGFIGGTNSLVKSGGGSLTFTNTGNNSFSGGVTINGGIVALGLDTSASGNTANENPLGLGTGSAQVNAGGQLRFGGKSGGVATYFITNAITLNGGTIFSADGRQILTNSTLNIAAAGGTLLTRWSGKDLMIGSQLTGSGPLTMDYGGGATTPGALVYLSNPLNTFSGIFSVNAYSIVLTTPYALSNAVFNPAGTGANLTWSGITNIVLGGLTGAGNINLGTGQLEVGNNGSTNTYSGILSGNGSLIKLGAGSLTLTSPNTYAGGTTISNGTLLVDGNNGPSAITVVSGATLGGGGTISGAVILNNGGAMAPGDSVGPITINNNLVLSNGCVLNFDLGPLYSSDEVNVSGSLSLGGTLNVNAVSGFSPNTYPLFTYGGALSGNLPVIGSFPLGHVGIISTNTPGEIDLIVQIATPPRITSASWSENNAVFSGDSGPLNYSYYVLASTNLTTPLNEWIRVATNQFDSAGHFTVSNNVGFDVPQKFYRLQLY